jgi:dCMP deaminase
MEETDIKKLITDIKNLEYRPSWDEYFIISALWASKRSSCDRLKVGCVIVKDNRIIATGYNGYIPKAPHRSVIRDNHEQMLIHAETNAITHAACEGTSLKNSTAYITHYPCINCTKNLIASGITCIYYLNDYKNDELCKILFDDAKISVFKIEI